MIDQNSIGRCNICGGTEFGKGFQGRLSSTGRLPACLTCKATERHRIVFSVYSHLRGYLRDKRALQFAPEGVLKKEWFKEYDYSAYGRHNSYDMMNIPLPDGAFDLVVSNHVIEHVADDARALAECLRVAGKSGVVHVMAPSPTYRYTTEDWGFADPARNEHYRDYGADMGRDLCRRTPGSHCVGVVGIDPTTLAPDIIFFFSRNEESLRQITAPLIRQQFGCVVVA
ncbi:MAG: methyltransferase domain-containing protein [Alphaproteobacteria bacterium]|nr:methyltransferase domain-containing protein [Alphaproteobacteria bacterium]